MRGSRATVSAPANIAFVKYWGAKALDDPSPCNPSISMTLSECRSNTTVEWQPGETGEDLVSVAGEAEAPAGFVRGVRRHLGAIRRSMGIEGGRFRVTTANTFPSASGLASSASGFAALAMAAASALELELDPVALSVLARRSGSGSAARSVLGGFVEWPAGAGGAAAQIAPASHWRLCDVIAVVETGSKATSSRDGHRRAPTSPHFERRLGLLPERLERARAAIGDRDLPALGPVLEEEAVELHLVAMSSRPAIFYWRAATLSVLERVRSLRSEGVEAWYTMDAGANVHVICEPADEEKVAVSLGRVPGVHRIIRDRVGDGPRVERGP